MLKWVEISNENRAKLQALGFAVVGVIGVAIVDRVSIGLLHPEYDKFGLAFFIGVVFL